MAARIHRLHQEDIRLKIQGSQLVNRLQDHAMGLTEMTPTQVRAAEALLDRTLPKLSQVEVVGDPEQPLENNHTVTFVGAAEPTKET